jgi:hypothetical protein
MEIKTTLENRRKASAEHTAAQNVKIISISSKSRWGRVSGVLESLAAGFAFWAGFFLQERLNIHFDPPSFAGRAEMILISVGMAFGYAFIFVLRKCYMIDSIDSKSKAIKNAFTNLTCSYLLELGLLFIIKDTYFTLDKAGILFGYSIGIALLSTISPLLILFPYSTAKREGKKRLVLKSVAVDPAESNVGITLSGETDRIPKKSAKRSRKAAPQSKSIAAEPAKTSASLR